MSAPATIPAAALYWGRLPAGSVPATTSAQDFAFERLLPVPVETLHLARTRLPDASLVLIGITPADLTRHLATAAEAVDRSWRLVPESGPAFLADLDPASRERLNLLHGAFEARARRRWRHGLLAAVGGLALLLLGLAALGLERRTARLADAAEALRHVRDGLILRVLQDEGLAAPSSLPPSAQLVQAQRRLATAQGTTGQATLDPGASTERVLEELWRRWPRQARLQVDRVAIAEQQLSLRGLAPGAAEAEALARTLGSFSAAGQFWQTGDPDISNAGEDCRFTITFRASPLPGGTGATP